MLACFHVGFTLKLYCQAVVGHCNQLKEKVHAFYCPLGEKNKNRKHNL